MFLRLLLEKCAFPYFLHDGRLPSVSLHSTLPPSTPMGAHGFHASHSPIYHIWAKNMAVPPPPPARPPHTPSQHHQTPRGRRQALLQHSTPPTTKKTLHTNKTNLDYLSHDVSLDTIALILWQDLPSRLDSPIQDLHSASRGKAEEGRQGGRAPF